MKNIVESDKKLTNFYNEVSGNLKIDIKTIDISNLNSQDDVLDYVNKIGFERFDNELIGNLIKMVEISNIKVLPLSDFFMNYGKDTMLCKNKVLHYCNHIGRKHPEFCRANFKFFRKGLNNYYDELAEYYDSLFKDCKEVITVMENGSKCHDIQERIDLYVKIAHYYPSDYDNPD